MVLEVFFHLGGGVVLGAVVDDEDLHVRPGGLQHLPDRRGNHGLLVVAGDENGDEGTRLGIDLLRGPAVDADPVIDCEHGQEQEARHADQDGGHEHGSHELVEVTDGGEHRPVQEQLVGVAACGRHGLGRWHAHQVGHRHQFVAVGAQGIDQVGQGLDRVAAIAATVMQQHHLARDFRIGVRKAGQGPRHDQIAVGTVPVIGVHPQTDGHIPKLLRRDQRGEFRRRRGRCVSQIGRTEEPQGPTGDRLEQALGQVEFQRYRARRFVGDVGVGVGVAADDMAFIDLAADDLRIVFHVPADHEERRRRALGLEDVEDLRRPARIGAVVEGQGHLARLLAQSLDNPCRREHLVGLVTDEAGRLVEGEAALAGCRLGGHVQHFPEAVEVDVVAGRHVGQGRDGRHVIVPTEQGPDPRVLGTQAPDGIAPGAPGVRDLDLVVQGGGIEEPHFVRDLLVVGIPEGGVQGRMVEHHRHAGIMGRLHGLVEGDGLGVVFPLGPVVAIGAQGQDDLVRVEALQILGQLALEPGLGRGRAWRAGLPMLVVHHRHDGVGGLLQGPQGPVRVIHRHRHPDLPVRRVEGEVCLRDELRIGRQGFRRQVLEIEDVTGEAALFRQGLEVPDQGSACLRRAEQLFDRLGDPDSVNRIVDHRHDGGPLCGIPDQLLRPGVGRGGKLAVRRRYHHPLGRQHVDILQMFPQPLGRLLIPTHVEGDGERACGRALDPGTPGRRSPRGCPAGDLHIQGRQGVGVAEPHLRHVGGKGQSRGKGCEHGKADGDRQSAQQADVPCTTAAGVVKHVGLDRARLLAVGGHRLVAHPRAWRACRRLSRSFR